MNIGKQINAMRKENNLSQDEFAEIFNVTRQTVSNWENEKSYPDLETIMRISDYFKISVDDMLKNDKAAVKKIDSERKKKNKLMIIVFILIAFAGAVLLGAYIKFQSDTAIDFKMEDSRTYRTDNGKSEINAADGYFILPESGRLNIGISAGSDDGMVHIVIKDEKDNICYQLDGQSEEDEQTLYFEKGSYTVQIVVDDYDEDVVYIEYSINIKN